ncbi:MAG: DUF2071 domain-containing protein [Verrucomicrobiales bacterium]|nr:DUF2071 domain-containing protein [Verrucomicrobiales bacterium]
MSTQRLILAGGSGFPGQEFVEESRLNSVNANTQSVTASTRARRRLLSRQGEPLLMADWERVLMIHFQADAEALQRDVPFPLDLRDGRAYVSLVAFTMRGMRLRFGGGLGAWLCRPIGTHEFLNVRTYVRHGEESGIYFLAEWLPNLMCVWLGPVTFGLPYRWGRIQYNHIHESGEIHGNVRSRRDESCLSYSAKLGLRELFSVCPEDSLDDFLLERYTAFISRNLGRAFFRVWHEPWKQIRISVSIEDDSLIANRWEWFSGATQVGASYSPGVRNVWMGWPHRIPGTAPPLSAIP